MVNILKLRKKHSLASTDSRGSLPLLIEQLESRLLLAGDLLIPGLAPAVTVDSLLTTDSTPGLTGTVDDPDAFIQVTVGDYTYIADNNTDGTWSLPDDTITSALTDGTYNIVVTATDMTGNVGTDATIDELTIDTTAPVVSVYGSLTKNTTPHLSGTVNDPDASVEVTINGNTYDAVNNGFGWWDLAGGAISPALADGTYDIVVIAVDAAGNVGTDGTIDELTIDTTVPELTVDTLLTNDATPEITGLVNDPWAFIQVTFGGYSYIADNNADGTWTLPNGTISSDLSDGDYDILVTATDMAGNVSSDTTSDELTVDTTAAVVTIDNLSTNDTSPQLSGIVDDPDAIVEVTVDGNTYISINNGDGSWVLSDDTISPSLLNGDYDIVLTATDPVGNVGTDATTDELTIFYSSDTEQPEVENVVINNGDAQRSMLTSMEIQFSESVNLDELLLGGAISDYIELYNETDQTGPLPLLDDTRVHWDAANNTLEIDFTVDGFGGSQQTVLSDGRYELKLSTAAITDSSGNTLVDNDGEDDGWLTISQSTNSSEQDLHQFFGDSDGDGSVDHDDFLEFRKSFSMGKRLHPHYNSVFDADNDGRVGLDDAIKFNLNYQKKKA